MQMEHVAAATRAVIVTADVQVVATNGYATTAVNARMPRNLGVE
jgi:hypothetical protein